MNINNYFDKIFIINLKNRNDRLTSILSNLNKFNITNYERIDAYFIDDLNSIPNNFYNNFRNNGILKHGEKYVNGAIGCKLSHVEAIKIAKNRNYKRILILEDDIFIRDNFNLEFEKLQKEINNIPDLDILLITGNHQNTPKKITKKLYKISETDALMGYYVNSKLYDFIIENANKSGLEIDVFYYKYIYLKNNSYCVIPHLLGHIGGYSNISNKDRGVFPMF